MFNTSLRLLPSAISSLKPFPAAARNALSAVVPDFPSFVGTLADKVAGVVTKVSEFAQQNPKAVQTALKAVAAFAGLRVAGLGTKQC